MIVGICGLAGSGKDTAADFLVKHASFAKVAFADPLKRICFDVYQFSEEQLWGPSEMRNAPDVRYPRPHGPFKDDSCLCCGVYCGAKLWREEKENHRFLPQCHLTPRFALQQLGSEWGRECYPPTWVKYAIRIAERLASGGHTYHYRMGLSSCSFVGEDAAGAHDRLKRSTVISDVRFQNEIDAIKNAGGKVLRVMRGAGLKGAVGQHRSETEQQAIPLSAFDYVIDNQEWSLRQLEDHLVELSAALRK